MVEQEGHRHYAKLVSLCFLHRAEPISSKRLLDKMSLAVLDLPSGQTFVIVVSMVAIMAEDDQIVVGRMRWISVNMVFSENPNSSKTTNRAGVVRLNKKLFVKVHLASLLLPSLALRPRLQHDRRAAEAETAAQLIDQVALVGEVQRAAFAAGEYDELGRAD